MQHHLGIADRAAGKVDQAGVTAFGWRGFEGGRPLATTSANEVQRGRKEPTIIAPRIEGHLSRTSSYSGAPSLSVMMAVGLSGFGAKLNIFGGEQEGAGNRYCAQLHQPQHHFPPLHQPRQHHQHAVAL